MRIAALVRCVFVAAALVVAIAPPAEAETPAEALVSKNVHMGFEILNNTQLTQEQRQTQFESFLTGVTDLKRVAVFTLGPYADTASPADREAFVAAFRRYAVAVYRTFFAHYAGQTLKVTGSRVNAPSDDVVATRLIDTQARSGQPVEVDFRVRSDTGAPVIVDICISGVWLALAERDEFTAYLLRNKGDVQGLIAHLDALRARLAEVD